MYACQRLLAGKPVTFWVEVGVWHLQVLGYGASSINELAFVPKRIGHAADSGADAGADTGAATTQLRPLLLAW